MTLHGITPRYLSVDQFVEWCPGMTERAVRRRIERREMPGAVKVGSRILIDTVAFERDVQAIAPAPAGPNFGGTRRARRAPAERSTLV